MSVFIVFLYSFILNSNLIRDRKWGSIQNYFKFMLQKSEIRIWRSQSFGVRHNADSCTCSNVPHNISDSIFWEAEESRICAISKGWKPKALLKCWYKYLIYMASYSRRLVLRLSFCENPKGRRSRIRVNICCLEDSLCARIIGEYLAILKLRVATEVFGKSVCQLPVLNIAVDLLNTDNHAHLKYGRQFCSQPPPQPKYLLHSSFIFNQRFLWRYVGSGINPIENCSKWPHALKKQKKWKSDMTFL